MRTVDTGIYLFNNFAHDNSTQGYEFDPKGKIDFQILRNIKFETIDKNEWRNSKGFKLTFNKFNWGVFSKTYSHPDKLENIASSTRGVLCNDPDISNTKNNENYKKFL